MSFGRLYASAVSAVASGRALLVAAGCDAAAADTAGLAWRAIARRRLVEQATLAARVAAGGVMPPQVRRAVGVLRHDWSVHGRQ